MGDISINEPIVVRITNTQSENIPFMEYLMKYKNINNNNLLESLNSILNLFRRKVHSIYSNNENVEKLFQNVSNDWYLDNDIMDLFRSSITDNFFDEKEKCYVEFNRSSNLCDELIEINDKEKDIPIESILHNELPINRKASGILFLCNDIYKIIEKLYNRTDMFLKEYNNEYKHSVLIDLSTKLRSCYNCNNIPINIHNIFMNFLIIQNYFYKELLKLRFQLGEFLNKISEKCKIMKGISENNDEVANLNFMDYLTNNHNDNQNDNHYDNMDYLDNISDNDDGNEKNENKEISNIFHNISDENDENDENDDNDGNDENEVSFY